MNKVIITFLLCLGFQFSFGQENTNLNKFRQLHQELPTPNTYRTASGAPGHQYWQQRADYEMDITLDDNKQTIHGSEKITFYNNSPDHLSYLWLQLDQNMRAKDSDTYKIRTNSIDDNPSTFTINRMQNPSFEGGFNIEEVADQDGKSLDHTINKTMMRIDLEEVLAPGEQFSFSISWWYNINDRMKIGGRSGYEYFEKDDNYLYTIAQFFPRMCMYNDVYGWQHKQFLGRGEFTLLFGDYTVNITVPDDHLVSATGTLQNPDDVLTNEQRNRLDKAKNEFEQPVIIATQKEAEKREESKSRNSKTWTFYAENVRDFAFASSRKFIWDAMNVKQEDGTEVMAMSMYPKEGNPLWERYSTKAVAHTIKWYSHYTFPYPYPVAWSINAARIGMEYPMICFNYGRCEEDGSYTERTKYGMISVIIHEVGHNYFPMIVNSDERQWTWMDEGLNTFVQFLTEQHWQRDYPSRRGHAHKIVDYMKGDKNKISPIMTNSESIHQFGNNAYGKPATALNILRESVMGRELFDFAFKEYSNRWKFKHPTPADFFRTMEDASAVDLDWFWRGWFYTNDHVDLALSKVNTYQLESLNPENREKPEQIVGITSIRNATEIKKTYADDDKSILDFYNSYDPNEITQRDREEFERKRNSLSEGQKKLFDKNSYYYELTLQNIGGLVMPVIVRFNYVDGSNKVYRIPAEIWKINSEEVTKVFVEEKQVSNIELDPFYETADTDRSNNFFPPQPEKSKFDLYMDKMPKRPNPMQQAKKKR